MTQVQWRLRNYLTRHGLTAYKLATVLPDLHQPTIYRLASEHTPQSVNLELLGKILHGLKTLTGEEVTPNDLFEVVRAPEPVAESVFIGTVQKWKKTALRPPYANAPDSTAPLQELRGER